jgi:hypothetical protein
VSRLLVLSSVTLDGVMQAPGRPDEDLRDGFQHGGWAPPEGAFAALRLVDSVVTSTGVIIATYRSAGT